ncbi:MAG: choice-of-anchor R domain-containing protein, partial [Patescibacteria group bacterium]
TSFTDSTNAGYYFGSEGIYCGAAADATLIKYAVATGLIDLVGTISSRSTATIAAAINSSGNLVNDIINLRLDSSAKSILSDFAFASTDYSGALKCGTITWNATTGAITGGSGGVFHKGGIVFANAGVATITLDGATGNATFAGSLSAPTGNIGGFTIGATTLTGGTTNIVLDSSNKAISINDATFGNQGIQLQYNAGTPRAYVGNGVDQYFQFDGTKVIIAGSILNIDSSTDIIIGQMQTTYPFTTGEAITAGDAVCFGGQTLTKFTTNATGPGDIDIGKTGFQQEAQSFNGSDVDRKVNIMYLKLMKTGTPTDNLVITIEGDSGGAPDGTPIETFTKAGADLTTSLAEYAFTLPANRTFTAATTYWVRFKRSGSLNDTNYFRCQQEGSSTYANGTMKRYNGASWTDWTVDSYLVFKYVMTEGLIYQTSAVDLATTSTFVGFAQESKAAGLSCKVQISDVWTTSGLTIASIYYLSNTYGAIATSAGDNSKKVGLSISTTKLNILNMI